MRGGRILLTIGLLGGLALAGASCSNGGAEVGQGGSDGLGGAFTVDDSVLERLASAEELTFWAVDVNQDGIRWTSRRSP